MDGAHTMTICTVIFILCSQQTAWARSLRGQEFYLAFMRNKAYADWSTPTIAVSITNPSSKPVEVSIMLMGNQNYSTVQEPSPPPLNVLTIEGGQSLTHDLPRSLILTTADKHTRSLHVLSTAGILLHTSMDSDQQHHNSATMFSVLPKALLMSDYIVGTHCNNHHCVCVITSVEDGNEITLSLRITQVRSHASKHAVYKSTNYTDGQNISESLQQGESMQVLCNLCDMTGSLVTALKPVAVFSGGEFTKMTSEFNSKDAVAKQMFPIATLGKHYVLASNYNRNTTMVIVKIVPLNAGDYFTYNGSLHGAMHDRELFSFTRTSQDVVEVTTNSSAVFVVELMCGLGKEEDPDLSMLLPVPTSQWEKRYDVVPVLPVAAEVGVVGLADMYTFHVQLVLRTGDADKLDDYASMANMQNTTRTAKYDLITLKLTKAWLTIRCLHPDCQPFGGFVVYDSRLRSAVWSLRNSLNYSWSLPAQISGDQPASGNVSTSGDLSTSGNVSTSGDLSTSGHVSTSGWTTASHPGWTNPTTPRRLCACPCVNVSIQQQKENARLRKDLIWKNLLLNKTDLSAYKRSKTSAPDERMSSTIVGAWVVSCVVIIVFGVFIVGADVVRFARHLEKQCVTKHSDA